MTPEQKAAFVIANSITVLGELLGMHHENERLKRVGDVDELYTEADFEKVSTSNGLGWNNLMSFLQD